MIIAGFVTPATAVSLTSDADPLDDRQEHNQDGGGRNAHIGNIEDRPVRQLEKVDHVPAERARRSK
jgi:hypothetical protein